ncbi:exopolysaccharide transport family protein [Chitinophaga cymbidii]|uniref:Chain-length determining protein n=1 Tax=Chitinophaga cymbidii TaxID=1096750 RepID=A0A512RRN9_9BACT|nr:hypothetical protein [Chitinophaga cymbidii]GEP98360.1 chain-length determining protein [Chitinophaga cymbidii]
MDVVYYIKALMKKKWLIIIGTILAVVAAFFFTMNKSRLYVSNAQMSTGFTIKDQITLRDENVSLYEADVKFENVIQSITSPIVIGQLSYTLLLHDLTSNRPFRYLTEKELKSDEYKAFNKETALRICEQKLDSIQVLTSYNPEERKVLEYMKLCKYDYESIRKALQVKRLQRTDYIDITYRSENPEQSAFVVNTLYREFTRYYRSLRSERTVENVGTFEELVQKKKDELDQKVEALRMYKSSEGLLNIEAASGSELSLISQLEKSHLDESANNNTIRSSLQTVEEQLRIISQGKPAYTNNEEIVNIRKQINKLNDEYIRTGSNDHDLEQQIKTLRKQYQAAMASTGSTSGTQVTKEELQQKKIQLESELNASDMNLQNLKRKIGSLRSSVGSYANKEANVGTLQQEVLLAQDEYNKLKEKLNSAIDNRTVPTDNFRQTLKGQPAFEPESSKRLLIMGAAGIAVFFLSAMSILLKEFFDSSLKSPSIFEKNIDINLISTINRADLHKYSILEALQRSPGDTDASLRKRQNTFREMLRKLRYEIEASGKSVFLFTSTEPNQGKTTLVQAVAYSLSLSNKRVLVIDTNFCNNDLTVQLEAKPTLEKFSIEPEHFSIDKVRDLVTTYSIDNIEVFGCQGGDYTPTEILPKNHLLNYLPQLKEYYDFILMEGAPLNDYTDTKELAEYAEKVIVVFSSHASLKQTDKESIQFLNSLDDKLLGAVLNKVSEDYLEL